MDSHSVFFEPFSKLAKFYYRKLRAGHYEKKYAPDFDSVPTYLMFLGYQRSGHTLLGALLDAHPETWVAHELNVLEYIKQGALRNAIFAQLIAQGKWFRARGNVWTGYSYHVPGQWQGRYRQLKVIGDKRGGASTRMLQARPELLGQLYKHIDKDIRIIHNYRNPYDNITTRARDGNLNRLEVSPDRLEKIIKGHFQQIDFIHQLSQSKEHHILHVRHEDFVDNPRQSLSEICHFLGIPPYPDYLDAAAGIVRKSPNKSRYKIHWPEQAKQLVARHMARYDFLSNYQFDE